MYNSEEISIIFILLIPFKSIGYMFLGVMEAWW